MKVHTRILLDTCKPELYTQVYNRANDHLYFYFIDEPNTDINLEVLYYRVSLEGSSSSSSEGKLSWTVHAMSVLSSREKLSLFLLLQLSVSHKEMRSSVTELSEMQVNPPPSLQPRAFTFIQPARHKAMI